MQITSTFQYARNQIATSFNVRNLFLHATLDSFPNVFDDVDIQLLCRQNILEIPCSFSHWHVFNEWYTGALSSWKNHGLPPSV